MCLYPKLILNKRYTPTKKNKGVIPPCPDERLKYVTAACGECYECRKQKQRAWVTRMTEELKRKNQKRANPCQHKTSRRARRIKKNNSRLHQTKSRRSKTEYKAYRKRSRKTIKRNRRTRPRQRI